MTDPYKVHEKDTFKFMQTCPDNHFNLLYTDPPYNMGTQYIIDKEGHYRIKGKGSDFMNRWEVGDGVWWYDWFKEAYRVVKPGGFVVLHNIDRQSDLWTYYGRRTGFYPLQKLYWLFIDSFPKGVDTGLKIDNMLGVEREVVGMQRGAQAESTGAYGSWGKSSLYKKGKDQSMVGQDYLQGKMSVFEKTIATSDLAKKYDGYKHGIASLKQVAEEILVLWKQPIENVPRTIAQFERDIKGGRPSSLHPSVFNIRDTRVAPSKKKYNQPDRWTPQLIIHDKILPFMVEGMNHEEAYNLTDPLPKIKFLDEDLVSYNYCKKPTVAEKEYGLDELEERVYHRVSESNSGLALDPKFAPVKRKNIHPTAKPVELCKWILRLFAIPDVRHMRVYDAFAGSGSISIAAQELGMEWYATELDPTYVEIATYRIKGWGDKKNDELTLFGG